MGESRRQFHRARLVSSSPPCWRVATGNPPRPLENYCPWKGDGPPSLSPSATPFSLSLLGTEGDEWWASWGGFRPAESCAPCARSSTSGKNSIPRLKGMTRSSGPYSSSRPGNFHETAFASFSFFFFFFITHARTHTRSLSLRTYYAVPSSCSASTSSPPLLHVPPDTTDQNQPPSNLSVKPHAFTERCAGLKSRSSVNPVGCTICSSVSRSSPSLYNNLPINNW